MSLFEESLPPFGAGEKPRAYKISIPFIKKEKAVTRIKSFT